MDEQDGCEVGQTAPITVAGRTIGNPLAAVTGYLKKHHGTVTHYDLIAGTSGEVTGKLIKATRMPWMASRISAREEAWFIERARCAPWGLVAPHALLQDADLSVLFTDTTSGVTTNPANRALVVAAPDAQDAMTLDFNRAVNLPCAYTDFGTCPLPPAESRLPIAVEAGEKIPYERA